MLKQNITKRLPVLEAIALLVGTIVGAGFLGIPYVVSKIGYPLGVLLIVGIGSLITLQFLMIAEITLRTRKKHQIGGYIERYLGPAWRKVAYLVVILESYGALLAYIVGAGQVLGSLFGQPELILRYVFFAAVATAAYFGLRLIERLDLVLTLLVVTAVVLICFFSWSALRVEHLATTSARGLLQAYGVILFSFLGATAVPEAREALVGQERRFPYAIVMACLIPIALYSVFTAAVLGVTGAETSEIATVGLGQRLGPVVLVTGNLLALLTMTTAFFGLSLAIIETYSYDLKFSRNQAWLLTMLVPFILSLGFYSFIKILLVVGALFGGLLGIILVATSLRAEHLGDRQPEFVLPHKRVIGAILCAVFILGIVYSIWNVF